MIVTRHATIAPLGRLTHGRFSLPSKIVEQIEVRSPHNPRDVMAVFPCGADDVGDAVESASRALGGWSRMSWSARVQLLGRVAKELAPLSAELSLRIQRELGRPGWECGRELGGLAPRLREVIASGAALDAVRTHPEVIIERRPLGVVVVLGPVMLPIGSVHGAIVAALAAGNTVVYKPSSLACATAQLYAQAFLAAGLPPGVFNLLQGGEAVGERLLAHPDVNGAVFIGSAEHARAIRRATAERLDLKTMLHVGARNSAVVLSDADVTTTVSELLQGAFATAGQRCTALSRVLVETEVLEPFLEEMVAACKRIVVGPPTRPGVMYGPMFSRPRLEQFLARLSAAEADGALALLSPESHETFVRPSIHLVEDPARGSSYRNEELFGPNLMVEPIGDLDAAIAGMRGRGGLYASLFSKASDHWTRFCRGVQSGALLWNHSPLSVSARVPLVSPGRETALRGSEALLALTRGAPSCSAPTAPGVPVGECDARQQARQ